MSSSPADREIDALIGEIVDTLEDYDDDHLTSRALARLADLLEAASPTDKPAVRAAMLEHFYAQEEHDELVAGAEALRADPHASPGQRAWADLMLARTAHESGDVIGAQRHLVDLRTVIDQPGVAALAVDYWQLRLALAEKDDSAPDESVGESVGEGRAAFLGWLRPRVAQGTPAQQRALAQLAVDPRWQGADSRGRTPGVDDVLAMVSDWPWSDPARPVIFAARFDALRRQADAGQRREAIAGFDALAGDAARWPDEDSTDVALQSLLQIGQAHIDLGEAVEARAIFERVARGWSATAGVAARIQCSQAWYWWARLTRESGATQDAAQVLRAHLDAVWKDETPNVRAWAAEGMAAEFRAGEDLSDLDDLFAAFGSDESPEVRKVLARALTTRATRAAETGGHADARADYERILELWESPSRSWQLEDLAEQARKNLEVLALIAGDHSHVDELYPRVRGLVDQGDAASAAGDFQTARDLYEQAFATGMTSANPTTRTAAIVALGQLAADLAAQRLHHEVIDVAGRLLLAAPHDEDHRVEVVALGALLRIATAAGHLGDTATALRASNDTLARWAGSREPSLLDQASLAAYNRAVLIDNGTDPQAAAAAYEYASSFSWPEAPVGVHRRIAKSLTNKAITLRDELGRPDLAQTEWSRIVGLYGASQDPELTRLSQQARAHLPAPPPKKKKWFG